MIICSIRQLILWLIVLVALAPALAHAFQQPEQFVALQEYIAEQVEDEGVGYIQNLLPQLENSIKNQENFFVAGQLQRVRLRIEKQYGKKLAWTAPTLKSNDKIFVLADWSRFSPGKSTLKPSDIKKQEEQIARARTISASSSTSGLPTVTPKFQSYADAGKPTTALSYGQQKPLIQSNNTRTQRDDTVEAVWPSSSWVTIELDGWWIIDVARVQRTRQGWVNDLRASRSLPTIRFDTRLHKTATDWALTIRNKQSADHKRFSNSPYYSYAQITERFRQRGITFKNINRATYTENIGRARFRCTSWDCTDEAIASLKHTYDYFRNEEGQVYDDHRRTMIHPLFGVMGVGVAVDDPNDTIYIAIHYGTEVE